MSKVIGALRAVADDHMLDVTSQLLLGDVMPSAAESMFRFARSTSSRRAS